MVFARYKKYDMPSKKLPDTLTTLDFVKTAALVLMLVDHIGFFFFPVQEPGPDQWWRVFGRMCIPVWFFLVGYARSRDLSWPLWGGAAAVLAANIICGWFVFPLNILFSMILIRLVIDRIATHMFLYEAEFLLWVAGMFILAIPTLYVTEYGTLGLMIALLGYGVRYDQDRQDGHDPVAHPFLTQRMLFVLYAATTALFFVSQGFAFAFDWEQLAVMTIGVGVVLRLLMTLRVRTYAAACTPLGRMGTALLRVTGRHTLILYVAHIILLQMVCWFFGFGLPIYGLFEWEWTAPQTFAVTEKP